MVGGAGRPVTAGARRAQGAALRGGKQARKRGPPRAAASIIWESSAPLGARAGVGLCLWTACVFHAGRGGARGPLLCGAGLVKADCTRRDLQCPNYICPLWQARLAERGRRPQVEQHEQGIPARTAGAHASGQPCPACTQPYVFASRPTHGWPVPHRARACGSGRAPRPSLCLPPGLRTGPVWPAADPTGVCMPGDAHIVTACPSIWFVTGNARSLLLTSTGRPLRGVCAAQYTREQLCRCWKRLGRLP